MVEIEAPVEDRVCHSCLVLAEAYRLEGREWPSRAFCGSRLQGSWRDLLVLVMPLIPDEVNFFWLECRVLGCGPTKVRTILIGTAWRHTELPEPCQLCSYSVPSSSATIVSMRNWLQLFWWIFTEEDFIFISLLFRTLFKYFFGFLRLIRDGLKWLSNDMALQAYGLSW